MSDTNSNPDPGSETEQYPLEPRYHPVNRFIRTVYDFLASAKLAMFLLVVILVCCVIGVTFFRGQPSVDLIFGTIWFNGLLVLLITNVACCFFGRIWGRRVTVVSFGMILFHLSFVAMFTGVIFNSLFNFNGVLRITEGETLSNRDPKSYDFFKHGRFFNFASLKGETTLLKMHRGYKVDGKDKVLAYELSVADGRSTKNGILYITRKFTYKGVDYFRDREGYSLLTILFDHQGRELYGAHLPLQSIKQKDETFIYTTGSAGGAGALQFPPEKGSNLITMQLTYTPDKLKERVGSVRYQVWPAGASGLHDLKPALADGVTQLGDKFFFGQYTLTSPEVRYWVAMNVLYEPGKPLVLTSLWVGLTGMIITMFGRIVRGRR